MACANPNHGRDSGQRGSSNSGSKPRGHRIVYNGALPAQPADQWCSTELHLAASHKPAPDALPRAKGPIHVAVTTKTKATFVQSGLDHRQLVGFFCYAMVLDSPIAGGQIEEPLGFGCL